ncbi:uncharacterized protein LOC135478240 isoform X2 [Liolophura sinensis]|uniref:uncharacterized protein LOC135478240 isoform X2 n=1 Tax=Liolophura sinensis TaxID=3198878 RepID=UPI003159305C
MFHKTLVWCFVLCNPRKRPHNVDNDVDDCLPISKRIHRPEGRSSTEEEYQNLMRSDNCNDQHSPEDQNTSPWAHLSQNPLIGTGDLQSAQPFSLHGNQPIQRQSVQNNPAYVANQTAANHVLIHDESASQGRLLPISDQDMDRYSPELPEADNPHYFQINRLLYEANSSRLLRSRSSCRLINNQHLHMS